MTLERSAPWTLLGVACAAALGAFFYRGGAREAGESLRLDISLAPRDRSALECRAADGPAAGLCRPRGASRAVPVVTTSGQLYVVSELFSQPALEQHLRQPGDQRFVARCEGTLRARVPQVEVRFSRRGRFEPARSPWLVALRACEIVPR